MWAELKWSTRGLLHPTPSPPSQLPAHRQAQQQRSGTTPRAEGQREEILLLGSGECWSQEGGLVRPLVTEGGGYSQRHGTTAGRDGEEMTWSVSSPTLPVTPIGWPQQQGQMPGSRSRLEKKNCWSGGKWGPSSTVTHDWASPPPPTGVLKMYLEPQCRTDSHTGWFTGEATRGSSFGIGEGRGRRKKSSLPWRWGSP